MGLRKWQAEALELYRTSNKRTFTVTATPGAGKTTFALTLAAKLLEVGQIDTLVVVVPTDHLRNQWSDAAIEKGIFIDPSLSNNSKLIPPDFQGYVATYAQIALNPALHRARTVGHTKRTMVIFDEIHHAGDGYSWGDGLLTAFGDVTRRLCLTGTPFRTGDELIPFVKYEKDEYGVLMSKSDYTYGYKEALEDGVVRPVSFAAYSSSASWSNNAGEVLAVKLGDDSLSKEHEQGAWKAALDPKGEWIKHVVKAADERLTQVRESGMKNAAAMILARDKETARAYAKIVENTTGFKPTVILSDDKTASKKIDAFSASTDSDDRWMVAVKMVSEGVDVPRLAVGVWATTCKTALFFAQAVGRFVRCKAPGETATIFLPAVRNLLALAATLEEQRNHVIAPPKADDEDEDSQELIDPMMEENEEGASDDLLKPEVISSEAEFNHVIFNGQAFNGRELSDEELNAIGIPGLLNANEIATLLHKRDEEIRRSLYGDSAHVIEEIKEKNPLEVEHEKKELRKEINRYVSRIALSKNLPHAQVHARTRKAIPGKPTAVADISILEKRLEWLQLQ